jgi:hypothetical protein
LAGILFFCALIYSQFAFALEEEILDRYPATAPLPETKEEARGYFKPLKDNVEVMASVDLQQGYDNNVNLDSKRHQDGFIQALANVEAIYPKKDKLRLKLGTDLFSTKYYRYYKNDLFDFAPYVGFDMDLLPNLTWYNKITVDYFVYFNDKKNTYAAVECSSYLRQFLTDDLYHEIGGEYFHRWYPDRKASRNDARRDDYDREDDRYRLKHTVGMYFPNCLVKVSNEVYRNDSNDKYQDYYDYWVYRLRPSILYFFTEKLYTNLSFIYKYTPYDSRLNTEDPINTVKDHTYIVSTSLYYDLMKDLTLGVTYSYTENRSNDPFQKYSGSILSGGFYYTF